MWRPYFPLGSFFDRLPSVSAAPAVRHVAAELGVQPGQVGLAWLLAQSPEVVLIPGTTSVAHLQENVQAGTVRLTDANLARPVRRS